MTLVVVALPSLRFRAPSNTRVEFCSTIRVAIRDYVSIEVGLFQPLTVWLSEHRKQ